MDPAFCAECEEGSGGLRGGVIISENHGLCPVHGSRGSGVAVLPLVGTVPSGSVRLIDIKQ